jgi:hypothetical protein
MRNVTIFWETATWKTDKEFGGLTLRRIFGKYFLRGQVDGSGQESGQYRALEFAASVLSSSTRL